MKSKTMTAENAPSMTFFKAWFAFCAFLALALFVGSVYVVYLLLAHFGVIA